MEHGGNGRGEEKGAHEEKSSPPGTTTQRAATDSIARKGRTNKPGPNHTKQEQRKKKSAGKTAT